MKLMNPVEQANHALQQVKDAGSGKSALELGWIEQIRISPPRAVFRLSLPGFAQGQRDRIVTEARETLLSIDGIDDVPPGLEPSGSAGPRAVGYASPAPGTA